MTGTKHSIIGIVAALALAMVGCVSGSEPAPGGSESDLLLTDGLDTLDDEEWSTAFEGCEGQLSGDVSFAIASADAHLVAALDANGTVVCVDTVEAVQEELEESGRTEEADDLVTAFAAAAMASETECGLFGGPNRGGDPDPEPNIDQNRFRMEGDPDPEPNVES